jgi:hypothetical protein
MDVRGLNLSTSSAVKEKRLTALLAGRDPASIGRLEEAVEEAQIVGSLELAGVAATADDVRSARQGSGPDSVRRLLAARQVIPPGAPFSVAAVVAWHRAACPPGGFRTTPRPDAPVSSPVEFIESRLGILEQWINTDSRRQLKPAQAGALALARILEILPFTEGNGLVSRLAASHLMTQGGARPPILLGTDAARLGDAVHAAFQLATEPLAALLDEASGRCLDVMIRALE